jgi:hypothetical protein
VTRRTSLRWSKLPRRRAKHRLSIDPAQHARCNVAFLKYQQDEHKYK